jgi:hypothetical protein
MKILPENEAPEKLPQMTDNQFLVWASRAVMGNMEMPLREAVAHRLQMISRRRTQRPHITAIRLLTYTGPREEVDAILDNRHVRGESIIEHREVTIRETMVDNRFSPDITLDLRAAGNKPRLVVGRDKDWEK